MSPFSTRSRVLAVGVLCAAGGVGAGAVATAGASTSHSSTTTAHHAKVDHGHGRGDRAAHPRMHAVRAVARHSVAGEVTVDTKQGFKTISFERGTVDSVSGDQLTITEGASKLTQRNETITVSSTAHVRDNGTKASLSSVSAGEHVLVVQGPKRVVVIARTPKHAAQ